MAALGYKHNRGPFRYLAEQIPLADLKALAAGDALNAYAVFMGAAGLLPAQAPARWPAESRAFVRRLWDTWWKHQAAWSGRALSRRDWKLSGLRPPNHPQRRLMLAALLFVGQPDLARRLAAIRTDCPDAALAEMAALLQPGPGPFWARRLSLSGPPRAAPVALLGKARTAAILANVLVPFLAAAGNREVLEPDWLRRLPPEDDNQVLRQAARALLGPDHNPALYRSGLRQQGLLQIFHEFCLNDRSGCARCALPGLLAAAPRRA